MSFLLCIPAVVVALMASCQPGPQADPNDVEAVVRSAPPPERIVRLPSGDDVTYEAMMSDLLGARAVFVGEDHDNPHHKGVQYLLLRDLQRQTGSLALGVEWFQQPYQAPLDEWVDGRIDERVLREQTEYDARWGYDFRMVRPILEFSRSQIVPITALNVPREISMAVAREGLDGLDETQRAYVPADLVRDDPEYRAFAMEALADHPGLDADNQEHFYEAQLLWDEAMGRKVVDVLEGGAARVLVFAGRMHVEGSLGIPRTVARRGVTPTRVVLPVTEPQALELAEAARAGDRPVADYLWVLAPE